VPVCSAQLFITSPSLQRNRAEEAAHIASILHRYVIVTEKSVEEAKRVTQETVLETIKSSAGGMEVLVLIHNHRTLKHHGKAAAKSRVQTAGFCKHYLFSFLQMHMGVRYDGKYYENLQLHSSSPSGSTVKYRPEKASMDIFIFNL
jgi:hypothetical protein